MPDFCIIKEVNIIENMQFQTLLHNVVNAISWWSWPIKIEIQKTVIEKSQTIHFSIFMGTLTLICTHIMCIYNH